MILMSYFLALGTGHPRIAHLNIGNYTDCMNERLAEFVGAMIGDGCLSVINSKTEKRHRKEARLTGNLQHDCAYYEEIIRPTVQEFGINGYLQKRPKRNCVYFVMGAPVFDFLASLGFPIGKKYDLKIPDIIFYDRNFSRACVRGIFNTDGSIYRRYSKRYQNHPRYYDYFVIQFKMNSLTVIEQIKEILSSFGINTNNIIAESSAFVLRITNQQDIAKFMNTVQPSSKYHVERYLNSRKKADSQGLLAQLVEHS